MGTMLINRLQSMEDFTNNEKTIAKYILEHMELIYNLTAEELAKRTYTSKATVLRLSKKVGTDGYHDFKKQLEQEHRESYKVNCLLGKEPINEKSAYRDIVNIIPSLYENAVSNTKLSLDKNAMQRIINHINRSEKVDLYGSGVSQTVVRGAAFKFMSIGVECVAHDGINEHYISVTRETRKRMAILVTFTGSNPAMVQAAKYLRETGIYTVGIGGSDSAQMRSWCNEYIEVYTKKLIMSMEVITSITATTYIFDILFAALLAQNYQKNLDASIEVWRKYERD